MIALLARAQSYYRPRPLKQISRFLFYCGCDFLTDSCDHSYPYVAIFTKEVNPQLAKRPLVFNGRLANRWLTSLVKEATYG